MINVEMTVQSTDARFDFDVTVADLSWSTLLNSQGKDIHERWTLMSNMLTRQNDQSLLLRRQSFDHWMKYILILTLTSGETTWLDCFNEMNFDQMSILCFFDPDSELSHDQLLPRDLTLFLTLCCSDGIDPWPKTFLTLSLTWAKTWDPRSLRLIPVKYSYNLTRNYLGFGSYLQCVWFDLWLAWLLLLIHLRYDQSEDLSPKVIGLTCN